MIKKSTSNKYAKVKRDKTLMEKTKMLEKYITENLNEWKEIHLIYLWMSILPVIFTFNSIAKEILQVFFQADSNIYI